MPRFNGALDVAQVAGVPATPVTGRSVFYGLSDGKAYLINPAGTTFDLTQSSNQITSNTTQTGLTGDKTSSGNWTSLTHAVTGVAGAASASRYAGATVSGAPASGTFLLGDFVVAQNGHLFICTAAGTPGTWADAGTASTPANMMTTNTTQTGMTGDKTSAGNWTALTWTASGLAGATAASRFAGGTASGAPTSGTFLLGDFIVDQSGKMWVCYAAGTPGSWLQVGGGASFPSNYTFAQANTTFTDGATYSGFATVANGWPVEGLLSGYRLGTTGTQRLQSDSTGQTYARYWINGSSAWSAFSLYQDSHDYTAKGSLQIGTANNAFAELVAGANTFVLTADSTTATGLKWAAPAAAASTYASSAKFGTD